MKHSSFDIDSIIRDEASKPSNLKQALAQPIRLGTRGSILKGEDSLTSQQQEESKFNVQYLRTSSHDTCEQESVQEPNL